MESQLGRFLKGLRSRDTEDELVTSIYYLIKELKCLPEIIGREYELVYEDDKITKIIQKPMKISSLVVLLNEMKEDYKRQEKEMEKSKRKGRRR